MLDDQYQEIFSWCHSINDEIHIYQWSESDYEQNAKELELKRICLGSDNAELLREFQDFQKEFGEKLGLSRAVSLKDAVMYAGIDFFNTKPMGTTLGDLFYFEELGIPA